MLASVLRVVALAIAVLALVDPSCVADRRDRPLVSIVTDGTPVDNARARVLDARLADRWTVVTGWLPAADAVVVLGEVWPAVFDREVPSVPVFVVPPPVTERTVRWRALEAPATVRLGEAIAVRAELHGVAADDDSLVLTVRRDDVTLLRTATVVRDAGAGDAPTAGVAPFMRPVDARVASVDTGTLALSIEVQLVARERAAPAPLRGDLLVTVHDAPVRVLAHDVQPSWQATFVRRALEADARLRVATRVGTSRTGDRAVTVDVASPSSLLALPSPMELPVVVVGAAQALGAREVGALERWARAGGSVVVLLDDVPGEAVQRWLGVTGWRLREAPRPLAATGLPVAPTDSLVGRRWVMPTVWATDRESWLAVPDPDGRSVRAPVVWSRPMGQGTVVVAGTADAWEARAPERSGFRVVWPQVVMAAADRVTPARVTRVTPAVAAPGAWREVEWQQLMPPDGAPVPPGGEIEPPVGGVPAGPGRWRAAWRALDEASAWPWEAADTGRLLIRAEAQAVRLPQAAALAALAARSGGAVLDADRLDAVGDALAASVVAASRRTPWQPMRSPWWLVPFAGALVGEWWLRRRGGLP